MAILDLSFSRIDSFPSAYWPLNVVSRCNLTQTLFANLPGLCDRLLGEHGSSTVRNDPGGGIRTRLPDDAISQIEQLQRLSSQATKKATGCYRIFFRPPDYTSGLVKLSSLGTFPDSIAANISSLISDCLRARR